MSEIAHIFHKISGNIIRITEIKPFSVLKELAEKKKEAMQARPPVGKSAKVVGAEIG